MIKKSDENSKKNQYFLNNICQGSDVFFIQTSTATGTGKILPLPLLQ